MHPTFLAKFPSLEKEGWLRDQEDFAKQPELAQTGWLVQATDNCS